MRFENGKVYRARVKTEQECPDDGCIDTIDKYRHKIFIFKYTCGEVGRYFSLIKNSLTATVNDEMLTDWAWEPEQLEFLDDKPEKSSERRPKKGFRIELYTKDSIEDYVVYFEEKHSKLIICYIQDSYLGETFKAKAVCHKDDVYNKTDGMVIAFDRCIEKRLQFYNKLMDKTVMELSTARDHQKNIEGKFTKFIKKLG